MKQRRSLALGAAKPSPKMDKEEAKYSYYLEIFLARVAHMRGCFAPGNKEGPQPWGQLNQVQKWTRNKHNTAMILNFFSSRCSHEGVLRTRKQRRSPVLGAAKPSPKMDNKQALYSYYF